MIRTRVGYSGGAAKNPTYHNLGDHAETLQVDYDPARVSYARLLDVFWKSHVPTSLWWSRQYMSAIFYHNEEQKKLALKTRDSEAAGRSEKIFTEVLPVGVFYMAEDYHQKYRLRQEADLMREFRAMYADEKGFISSTAAARVNGYLDGYGTPDMLRAELQRFGLSPEGSRKLLDIVARRSPERGCPL